MELLKEVALIYKTNKIMCNHEQYNNRICGHNKRCCMYCDRRSMCLGECHVLVYKNIKECNCKYKEE